MLDPENVAEVKTDIPAISIQYSIAFGQSTSLILTTGVELDADPGAINRALDKVVAAAERQREKYKLVATKDLLARKQQDLAACRAQYSAQEASYMAEWVRRGRQGEWKPQGNEKQQLGSLRTNEHNTVEEIKRLEKEVVELEEKCR
jgi:hypothetical protein